jgi:hypothetical protein
MLMKSVLFSRKIILNIWISIDAAHYLEDEDHQLIKYHIFVMIASVSIAIVALMTTFI